MKNLRTRLAAAAETLLNTDSYPGELLAAAGDLRETLAALAAWDDTNAESAVEINLDSGVAISPSDAARCILDYQRTVSFLRGTLAAIGEAQGPASAPIDVIYAGCGPLAPLAVALCHRLENVTFWPVDIHPASVASVQRLVVNAGCGHQFGGIVVADASQYHWPRPAHVAIAEVMQRALEKEPQIAVTANVAGQLVPGGLLVPEIVKLDIQLYDLATEFDLGQEPCRPRVRLPVAPFLDLRATTAASYQGGHSVDFTVAGDGSLSVMVSTRITVHGAHVLADYDSGLTAPWPAHDLGRPAPGTRARLTLEPGPSPRLVATLR